MLQVPHALKRMRSIAFGDENANGPRFSQIAPGSRIAQHDSHEEKQTQIHSGRNGKVCNP